MRRLMRGLFGPTLRDQLIQAEIEGPPVIVNEAELEAQLLAEGHERAEMSEEDMRAYHRLRANLTYGTEDENPAEVALLTEDEKERLEPFAIRQRWHRFWVSQGRMGSVYRRRPEP